MVRTFREPTAAFSVYKRTEGGQSFKEHKEMLELYGVTGAQQTGSPYVGQFTILVPKKFESRARKIIFGEFTAAEGRRWMK